MTIVGVDWTTNATSPSLTRIGPDGASEDGATNRSQHVASWPAGAPAIGSAGGTAWDNFGTWGAMQRCNLWETGAVTAHYGDRCFTDTDITNMGNVMVELTPHLYYVDASLANHIRYYIADVGDAGDTIDKADGSGTITLSAATHLHPAFGRGGGANTYIGAYHASVTGSKLESKANVTPTAHLGMSTYRTYAHNIGADWEQLDYLIFNDIKLRLIVEYASFNWKYVSATGLDNMFGETRRVAGCKNGHTSSSGQSYSTDLGNHTGSVPFTTTAEDNLVSPDAGTATNAISYRGIENLWGNITTFIEGINISSITRHVWTLNSGFTADVTYAAPWTDTGVVSSTGSSDYIMSFCGAPIGHLFIPLALGAGGYGNYYGMGMYGGSGGGGVCMTTGSWKSHDYASGPNSIAFPYQPTTHDAHDGARLEYIG